MKKSKKLSYPRVVIEVKNESSIKEKEILKKLVVGTLGVEGRISFLKRCFGLQRCLYRGELGFCRWVGWGIIAHSLTIISRETLKNKIK